MLIVCPTCSSEFAIEAERIGPTGRVVRCATCRGAWFVPPVETDAAPLEPGRGARRVRGRGKPAGFGGAPVQEGSTALLVLAIGLTLVIGMALAFRTTIVKTVPESAAAFALIGLPVNLVGLQLAGVTSEMTREPGGPVRARSPIRRPVRSRSRRLPSPSRAMAASCSTTGRTAVIAANSPRRKRGASRRGCHSRRPRGSAWWWRSRRGRHRALLRRAELLARTIA
jgi:predicted Zn finger-like uncharacterized protein